jgi:hypothetical protein
MILLLEAAFTILLLRQGNQAADHLISRIVGSNQALRLGKTQYDRQSRRRYVSVDERYADANCKVNDRRVCVSVRQ